MIPVLFLSTVLIWGTTWLAIALQAGPVPVLVSVFYRFALAGILFLFILAVTGRLRLPKREHQVWLVAQALCLFSLNFICFYHAVHYIPSGLESLIFSLSTIFNALNARIFYGERISGKVILASLLGISGLVLLFGRDILDADASGTLTGVGLAMLGTLFFSLGNMVSRRNSREGISPVFANAWAMSYGAIVLMLLIILTGTPLIAPPDATYLGALLYLAAIGSIVGFSTYLILVARIGSARAAYATVLFPIIALGLSTVFEGYVWHWTGFVGLGLALLGNIVIFAPSRRPRRTAPIAKDAETVASS
ncbi:Permease of the drug/metabolite transporter (DMT) superfamily [Cohaesibacter sp. ES.047]|uniref:DMT family transporter n=1 Tax=Cohaesibacter sp. ES.047 TaxID=1798205 RepID=UPI000BB87144|nr:EamA family transporter [Cohaesibacter sp. ES.047]SNY93716.1 Permease of the drug/metabolite transporter (DMT) superfamily [Cohaesibacter sp. ES.047]